MKTKLLSTLAVSAVLALSAVTAHAQTASTDTKVDTRIQNQENRVDAGVQDGTITEKQAARDDRKLNNIQTKEEKAEARNGGDLTKKQKKHLNKKLSHNSKKIHHQRKS